MSGERMGQAGWGTERDRRAPTVARCEMALQAQRYREQLRSVEEQLDGLDSPDRRRTRILVGQLAAQWIGEHGPSHRTLVAEIALGASTLRVDISSDPAVDDPGFWEALVSPRIEDLVGDWGIDRRRSSGLWLELARELG